MITVLCHGVFDLLHVGHLEHLRQAKAMGNVLWVSVVPDKYVQKRMPINDEIARITMLLAVRYVDGAFLCGSHGPEELIRRLKPSIYARGSEYQDQRKPEQDLLDELKIPTRFTESVPQHTIDVIATILERSRA